MSLLLSESSFSLQPEPTTTAQPAPSSGGGTRATSSPGASILGSPLLMIAVMFGVFYFLLIRPQQKRQREVDDMLKALRKGDKVRTSGGIRGEVVDLNESEVTLLIADKVKINVLRSHVASRLGAEAKTEANKEKT